jgi:hypothetical protein
MPKKSKTAMTNKSEKNISRKKVEKITPKAIQINELKTRFIQELRANGGNVSNALKISGLNRKTAYAHFKSDDDFRDDWLDAQEASLDDLCAEARKRALEDKSDSLLIYLMNQQSANRKWRSRLIKTGQLALKSVLIIGQKHGLSVELIHEIQTEMTTAFIQIQLT